MKNMNRQDAKHARKKQNFFFSWRSLRLGSEKVFSNLLTCDE
jgi:hypothetical protein